MKKLTLVFLLLCVDLTLEFRAFSQSLSTTVTTGNQRVDSSDNIYKIRQQYLDYLRQNPAKMNEGSDDNDLERFNRWFHFVEPRCFPSGKLPQPDAILTASNERARQSAALDRTTMGMPNWKSLGPFNVPHGFFGIGRIDVVVIDPVDTNTVYAGAACGGLWVSHDNGATWTSNTDNFPSLSISDIAVYPGNTQTIYAATGDKYGNVEYGQGLDNIFWGGLYSAGVVKSLDGGATWAMTGLGFVQSLRDQVQRLLVYPTSANVVLAASSSGIYRTSDGGISWNHVYNSNIYSMEFKPGQPQTVYAMNNNDLIVSYDAGVTWQTLHAGINTGGGRSTIAVSPRAPDAIWVMNNNAQVFGSVNNGSTFTPLSTAPIYSFGDYCVVFGVSPKDTSIMFAGGVTMFQSTNGGRMWSEIGDSVHPDNHCVAFNYKKPTSFYTANDGGIWRTNDNGNTWVNLCHNMAISQIYRMGSSRQNPNLMICGLQDNSSFFYNGTSWTTVPMPRADGMACGISPANDSVMVASYQGGNFFVSQDKGNNYNPVNLMGYGYWTAPVVFCPTSPDTIYFGSSDIFASYDRGNTVNALSTGEIFSYGAVSLAVAPSNSKYIYAADYGHMYMSADGGVTWNAVTGPFSDALPVTRIAVDYRNPLLVYLTVSGYYPGQKVFCSQDGGTTWSNISANLPNIPADCIAVDSSMPGALYVGTDIGVYYIDSTSSSWVPYGFGLPNVIVDDIDINYTTHFINIATYGRGIWQTLLNNTGLAVPQIAVTHIAPTLRPNPTKGKWVLDFGQQSVPEFSVQLTDATGRVVATYLNTASIGSSGLAPGIYNIRVRSGADEVSLKAIKD